MFMHIYDGCLYILYIIVCNTTEAKRLKNFQGW